MLAKNNAWKTIVSHRSGETEDTTIAHIAVGLGCGTNKNRLTFTQRANKQIQ